MVKLEEVKKDTNNEEHTNNKNDTGKEGIKNPNQYKIFWRVIRPFGKMVRSPVFPFCCGIIVTGADVYLFVSSGLANGFRALVAEGTLSLALVTYLQMKNAQETF